MESLLQAGVNLLGLLQGELVVNDGFACFKVHFNHQSFQKSREESSYRVQLT